MTTQVSGQVSNIWVNADGDAVVKLAGLSGTSAPRNSNFNIKRNYRNFNALYSLALSAAINRYNLVILTTKSIKSTENGIVKELWVDW